jgi:phosphatidate phosphatase APP1
MAVLLERLVRDHAGAPVVYLSTGAWNVAPTLQRFLRRHLFPPERLTDWGPTHDRWFRSGREHKQENLRRLRASSRTKWMLLGDDGQHDDDSTRRSRASSPTTTGVAIRGSPRRGGARRRPHRRQRPFRGARAVGHGTTAPESLDQLTDVGIVARD